MDLPKSRITPASTIRPSGRVISSQLILWTFERLTPEGVLENQWKVFDGRKGSQSTTSTASWNVGKTYQTPFLAPFQVLLTSALEDFRQLYQCFRNPMKILALLPWIHAETVWHQTADWISFHFATFCIAVIPCTEAQNFSPLHITRLAMVHDWHGDRRSSQYSLRKPGRDA